MTPIGASSQCPSACCTHCWSSSTCEVLPPSTGTSPASASGTASGAAVRILAKMPAALRSAILRLTCCSLLRSHRAQATSRWRGERAERACTHQAAPLAPGLSASAGVVRRSLVQARLLLLLLRRLSVCASHGLVRRERGHSHTPRDCCHAIACVPSFSIALSFACWAPTCIRLPAGRRTGQDAVNPLHAAWPRRSRTRRGSLHGTQLDTSWPGTVGGAGAVHVSRCTQWASRRGGALPPMLQPFVSIVDGREASLVAHESARPAMWPVPLALRCTRCTHSRKRGSGGRRDRAGAV